MAAVSLTVNGKPVTADVDSGRLLQLLRENLRSPAPMSAATPRKRRLRCHVNGKATKSCTYWCCSSRVPC